MENTVTLYIIIAGILLYLAGVWLSGTWKLTNPLHEIKKYPQKQTRKIRVICLAPNPDEHSAIA